MAVFEIWLGDRLSSVSCYLHNAGFINKDSHRAPDLNFALCGPTQLASDR
jgi:hypothetical protein